MRSFKNVKQGDILGRKGTKGECIAFLVTDNGSILCSNGEWILSHGAKYWSKMGHEDLFVVSDAAMVVSVFEGQSFMSNTKDGYAELLFAFPLTALEEESGLSVCKLRVIKAQVNGKDRIATFYPSNIDDIFDLPKGASSPVEYTLREGDALFYKGRIVLIFVQIVNDQAILLVKSH